MFKTNFIKLCNKNNISPSAVCKEIGITPAAYSSWSENSVPRKATLQKLADYFKVSIDYLIGNEEDPKQETSDQDKELQEYLQELKTRPEMKMLFSLAKGATKQDVEQAVAIIEALRKGKS